MNSTELASDGVISDTEALKIISNMSHKILDIMSVILDSSKIDRDSLDLFKSNVCIRELLDEAKIIADSFSESTIPIVIEIKKKIVMYADNVRLAQVFQNILNNAIKFTKKGFIHVTASLNKKDNEIIIKFIDTGKGIPPHMLPNIFKKYVTDSNHNKKGTCLGLYLCKGIVEKHGGTITAENNQLSGATFTIKLPFIPPSESIKDL